MGRRKKNRNSSRWAKVNEAFGSVKGYGDGVVSSNPWSILSGEIEGDKLNSNSRSVKLNKYVGYLIRSKVRK